MPGDSRGDPPSRGTGPPTAGQRPGSEPHFYDYAVIRVVPRVEREEFVNVGVIVSCQASHYLAAAIELDEARLRAIDPRIDLDLVREHLAAIPRVCGGGQAAGPIGALPLRSRFHWLTARRSAIVQTSPVHTGRTTRIDGVLEHLLTRLVRPLPPLPAPTNLPADRQTDRRTR